MNSQEKRILAVDPSTRGFGFAVLEGPERLVDWGVKEARDNKHVKCLGQIEKLIKQYEPDAIVVEDAAAKLRLPFLRCEQPGAKSTTEDCFEPIKSVLGPGLLVVARLLLPPAFANA